MTNNIGLTLNGGDILYRGSQLVLSKTIRIEILNMIFGLQSQIE